MYRIVNVGELNLTNYPATRVYFNPDHYSVRQLMKRYDYILGGLNV